jgi:putative oxidoreductase
MRTQDLGTLALRLGVGGALAAHGAQKLFGWFGGPGRAGAAEGFGYMGFPQPERAALAASAVELGGGALLAAGLATPAASAAVIGAMRTAADIHKRNGFFGQAGGYELAAVYAMAAGAVALTGPGRLSVDQLLSQRLARPWMAVAGIVGGIVAGGVVAGTRQTLPEREPEEAVDVSGTATTQGLMTPEEKADDEVMMGIQTPFQ